MGAKDCYGSLVKFGAELVTFVGASDVANAEFNATDDGFNADGRIGRDAAHLRGICCAAPFFFSLLRAFVGGFDNFFVDGVDHGIRILSAGQYNLQLIPEPLTGR